MYEAYLTTGILLLLAGITTTLYLLHFVKYNKHDQSIVLSIIQAVALVLMGVFYVYSASSMLHDLNNTPPKEVLHFNVPQIIQHFNITEINKTLNEEFQTGIGEVEAVPDEYVDQILNVDFTPTDITNENKENDFVSKYQEFLKTVLNKTITHRTRRKKRTASNQGSIELLHDSDDSHDLCAFKEMFLQQAMLVYSFVQGMITLINSTIACKNCVRDKIAVGKSVNVSKVDQQTSTDSSKIPNVKVIKVERKSGERDETGESTINTTQNLKPIKNQKLISLVLVSWLTPIICASFLYFITQTQEKPAADPPIQQFISKMLQNPTNVSTASEEDQINTIVTNVYRIIEEVKINSSLLAPQNKINITHQHATPNCHHTNVTTKVYTFVVFILSFFLVLLYSQTTYVKLSSFNSDIKMRNLRTALLGFSVLWLPSVLETSARVYLTDSSPSLAAELLLALGNFSHVLASIGNVLVVRKVVKSQSNVQPTG